VEGSTAGRSRKGFLLCRPGDEVTSINGAVILVGMAGNAEVMGVVAGLFRSRKGFVSEFWEADFGMVREGVGSSKGDEAGTEGWLVYLRV
jgi:hypothetical protein